MFANSTAVISLIQDGDESANRREWEQLPSEQPGAEHAQKSGHDSELQEKPSLTLPSITKLNNTMSALETFSGRPA